MESHSNISNSENAKELNENNSNALIPNNVILALYILHGIFSRFHRYLKFKIQRNKSEWCKAIFEEYMLHCQELS